MKTFTLDASLLKILKIAKFTAIMYFVSNQDFCIYLLTLKHKTVISRHFYGFELHKNVKLLRPVANYISFLPLKLDGFFLLQEMGFTLE